MHTRTIAAAAAPQAAGSSMPDFTSTSMKVARQALDGSTNITAAP